MSEIGDDKLLKSFGPIKEIKYDTEEFFIEDKLNSCRMIDINGKQVIVGREDITIEVATSIHFIFDKQTFVIRGKPINKSKPCYIGLVHPDLSTLKNKLDKIVGEELDFRSKNIIMDGETVKIELFMINMELIYLYNGTVDITIYK